MRPVAFQRRLRNERQQAVSLERGCPFPDLAPQFRFLVDAMLELEDEVAKRLYVDNRTPDR